MPKRVDHDQRRRHIVEALVRIAGSQGLDAVSLREVAQEAGVSMGAVQHYFASKDEMVLYALRHWLSLEPTAGFASRARQRLLAPAAARSGPDPKAILRALAAEYLPHDEHSLADARVAVAFMSRAAVETALAQALRPAFASFVETLRLILVNAKTPLDAPAEAQRLAALLDGLRLPVLTGALPYEDALAAAHRHLDDILS